MNKSKYKSKHKKPQSLPEYGWGSTIGGIAGGALGTLLGPFGTMAGSSLGAALGNSIDGEENTQGNQVQMPQLNIDPVNTQGFYNPVKAYGGYLPDFATGGGIPPAVFTNPNDPEYKRRLQAYNDSLLLNKYSEINYNKFGRPKLTSTKSKIAKYDGIVPTNFFKHAIASGKNSMFKSLNNNIGYVDWIDDRYIPNKLDKEEEIVDKTNKINPSHYYPASNESFNFYYKKPKQKIELQQNKEFVPESQVSIQAQIPTNNQPTIQPQVKQQPQVLPKMWVNQAGSGYEYNLGNGKGWQQSNKDELMKMKSQYQIQGSSDNNPFEFAFGGYMYPFGGQMNPNAEVEGNEVMQHNPNQPPMAVGQGNMQQIASDMSVAKGPTHANGGVPINAQPGSMVVSDRLPAPNTKEYKSIANKVEMLGRKKGQLEKKITANPNDKIAKDTIGLVQKQIDTLIQQQEQMKAQNSEAIMAKAYQKAFGGTVTGNERLDKDFLNMWNTGSYAYGGELPKFDGGGTYDPFKKESYRTSSDDEYDNYRNSDEYKNSLDITTNENMYPGIRMNNSGFNIYNQAQDFGINGSDNYSTPNFKKYQFNAQPTTISGKYNEFGQNKYGIDNASLGVKSNINAPYLKGGNPTTNESMMRVAKISNKPGDKKVPLKENTFGSNLQYAAQYIPDIIASFTKKDKPIDPNMYMDQSRVNAARYDTSAEEAAVQDARNQAMLLAKESSGGDAGMYANMGNVANTGSYKNLGQVYNRAQNINMQNQMAADQANAGIEGQNRGMALNIANMNQADASAVEDRRMAGMQGIANKLANNYSQDRQFKLLKDIAPHYNYNENNGELTFNGKKYYGEEAKTLLEQLRMNTSNAYNKILGFGQNLFTGGKG